MTTTIPPATAPPTAHRKLIEWVDRWTAILEPDRVHWCDGSDEEYAALCRQPRRVRHVRADRPRSSGPNSFYARSDPGDVARVEDRTFICSEREDDAGPTNNWRDPVEMRAEMLPLCTPARCAVARSTSCRSRWARSARRSRTSVSSSPTPPTSPRACAR